MSREMFINGRGIDDARQLYITERKVRRAKEKYGVNDSEFEKLKEQIDWDLLRKIFEEIAAKSGINKKDLNFIGPSQVVNCEEYAEEGDDKRMKIIGGLYRSIDNFLILNSNRIRKVSGEKLVDKKLMTLSVLIHEMCHAISFNAHIITDKFNNEFLTGESAVVVDGAYRSSKDSHITKFNKPPEIKHESFNDLLDEAITEKLAIEVFDRYINQTGLVSNEELGDYHRKYLKKIYREADDPKKKDDPNEKIPESQYSKLVKLMERLCQIVSIRIKVDPDIVWHGFVRGLFYKNTLSDPTIQQWFAEAFSPIFLDELKKVKDVDAFASLLEKYS